MWVYKINIEVESNMPSFKIEIVRQIDGTEFMLSGPNDFLHTNNPAMAEVLKLVPKVASCNANVLITGESGTGKEILAKKIHSMSSRSVRKLVAVNCASIPSELLESELFGYRKGSFTGAHGHHRGLFEMADQGTLFLDEIGDIPIPLQAKLLRVLQERKIRSIGCGFEKPVDFKLIAATHRDLKAEIRKGNFREDLYFRLNVIQIKLPPLRERTEDIPNLVRFFLAEASTKHNLPGLQLDEEAIENLMRRSWAGNIRQLENLIEQTVVLCQGKPIIGVKDLPDCEEIPEGCLDFSLVLKDHLPTVSDLVEDYLDFVLNHVSQNQTEAARILGVSRRTINRKVKQKNFKFHLK